MFSTVATISGSKAHYAQEGSMTTLCGRQVSNATGSEDLCKACGHKAATLAEQRERRESSARAAEAQDYLMQDTPVRELKEPRELDIPTGAQIRIKASTGRHGAGRSGPPRRPTGGGRWTGGTRSAAR